MADPTPNTTPGMTTTAGGTTSSGLSDWSQPYIVGSASDPGWLTKAKALGNTGYQAYGGPLTAGASDLQTKAFQGIGGLSVPGSINKAASTAGDVASKFAGMSYNPAQFNNQFTAPGAYEAGQFDVSKFGFDQALQYMNPFLNVALNPQLEELRRQGQITNRANQAQATKMGAFGGSGSALSKTEGERNVLDKMQSALGQGYSTAYDKAMAQFNADQTRELQAQQEGEKSRQFGAGQAMTAAQQAAQYGLSGQQETEKSKQFGANYGLESLKNQLAAAQAQGQLGLTENTANLANLQQQLTAGEAQRKIEAEGVKADLDEFNVQRDFPYKQIQFQRDILSGLPVSAITSQARQPNDYASLIASFGGMNKMITDATANPSVKKMLKYLGLDLDEALGP